MTHREKEALGDPCPSGLLRSSVGTAPKEAVPCRGQQTPTTITAITGASTTGTVFDAFSVDAGK